MLTTLAWWGIGIIGISTFILAFSFNPLVKWWAYKHPDTKSGRIDPVKNARVPIMLIMCAIFAVIVFFFSWMITYKSVVLIPGLVTWLCLFIALFIGAPSVGKIISFGVISVIVPIIFALFFVVPSFSVLAFSGDTTQAAGESYRNILVRSKLIEQNAQHSEASGETFLGAGSFTMRSDSDLKVYHVWQERDASGVLHVNVAQDGEGKDEKNHDKAVIKDDVSKGTEPYVERIPVYDTDSLFVKENNGKLCVKNQDTNCRVNAKHSYDKIIIHVPVGSVVPSVDPNLPVNK